MAGLCNALCIKARRLCSKPPSYVNGTILSRHSASWLFTWAHQTTVFSVVQPANHQALILYATLAYIRHFIFAGCYDNNPCYLVTNLAGHLDFAGHLDLAGFNFSKCPANSKCPAKFVTGPHIHLVMRKPKFKYHWAMDAIPNWVLVYLKTPTRTFMFWRIFFIIFGTFSAKILLK